MSGHINLMVQKLYRICSDSSVVRGAKYGHRLRVRNGCKSLSLMFRIMAFEISIEALVIHLVHENLSETFLWTLVDVPAGIGCVVVSFS